MTTVVPETPWVPRDPDGFVTLQGMVRTEQGICTERDLYLRLDGLAAYSERSGQVSLAENARLIANTWFNLFNLGKWRGLCELEDLHLRLEGRGRMELKVFAAFPDRSWECAVNEEIVLEPGRPLRFELSHVLGINDRAVAYFELRALEDGCLFFDAAWQTRQAPQRSPELMLSITTFRREEAVQATVRRFETFLPGSSLRDRIHLTVVDNGQSAGIESSAHVTAIPNENLGGSGGFARGLLAAQDRGASHCLFMDDDAAIHMESLERTWMFLAYATDPATAVCGAMTMASARFSMWENGAVFDHNCKPQFIGTDLRNPEQILAMEYETTRKPPANFYGGWWYFAFPLDQVVHEPFPFFVRGDDISFSLANPFRIARLNGVVCFQDADFSDKETLQTLYLDLRSHLVHHLTQPGLALSARGALRIPAWFFARSLVQCHYETLSALNLAFEDVMKGPEFFAENADMAERRATIGALRHDETLRDDTPPVPDRIRLRIRRRWAALAMLATLNGHLIPFYRLIGNRVTLTTSQRGQLAPVWGAAQITWRDEKTGKSFTMVHSKRRAWKETKRFLKNARVFLRDYDKIRSEWRAGYDRLATETFWRKRLKLDTAA